MTEIRVYGPAVLDKHAGDTVSIQDIAKGTRRKVMLLTEPVHLGGCDWLLDGVPGTGGSLDSAQGTSPVK